MKKKICITAIIILTIVVIAGIIILIFENQEKLASQKIDYNNFDVDQTLEVDICKNPDNCSIASTPVYSMIKMDTDNAEIKKIIDKINNETKKRYNKTLKSTFDINKCPNAAKEYNYSYLSTLDYSLYENNDYISISTIRYNRDLCLDKTSTDKPESYIYSKSQDKVLSQNEIKKVFDISDSQIEKSIKKVINNINSLEGTKYTYDNTFQNGKQNLIFYFDYKGDLNVYFYQNETNSYSSCTIIENTEPTK